MARLVWAGRKATITWITTHYNQCMQKSISECTERWTLKQMGYSSRRTHLVPLLSAKNRKLRMQFSRAHQNWTTEHLKSLNFCCGIQMLGSEFGVNNMLRKCNGSSSCCWFNGVGDIFLAHFGPLSTNWNWFLEHDNEFTMLKLPPDLSPEHLWDVMEVMLPWQLCIKISQECSQHIVKSMKWRIKPVLRVEGGPTRY